MKKINKPNRTKNKAPTEQKTTKRETSKEVE